MANSYSQFESPLKSSAKKLKFFELDKIPMKCSDSSFSQLFISITDFDTDETDDSHILIRLFDSMGQPQETKKMDKTNYYVEKWIQDGYLNTGKGAK